MSLTTSVRSAINFKFSYLKKSFGGNSFKLLDVGSGNHSASRIKSVFPNCRYYGLDMSREYNNDAADFELMEDFYELDLTKLDYSVIPDESFDGIWMAHVIEHLVNGDKVVPALMRKLKPGGFFYIEYPGEKSTRLPSMHGSLNFYDDSSHVRIYSVDELTKIFTASNGTVLESGTRRNWYYIISTPVRMAVSLARKRRLEGNIFWDLLGFAEFLYVRKR